MKINIADMPFRTIQGEGIFCGFPSVFIRTSGCNLRCEWGNPDGSTTKCDTPYSSHQVEVNLTEIEDVIIAAEKLIRPGDHLVITGGEPTIHGDKINNLIGVLKMDRELPTTMETNGTSDKKFEGVNLLSISPKLKSSGNLNLDPKVQKNFIAMNRQALVQLKFVVNTRDDMEEVLSFCSVMPKGDNIIKMLMPQGVTAKAIDERLKFVSDMAIEHGFCLSDRLHIRLFGGKRGA